MSKIRVSQIENHMEYLVDHADKIYIETCIGQRFSEEDDNDEYRKQISKLGLETEFNINEVIVFRTALPTVILFFIPMYDKLYIVESKSIILNVFLFLDGYIGFLFYEYLDILKLDEMSSSLFEMTEKSYMYIWESFEAVVNNKGPQRFLHFVHDTPVDIPEFTLGDSVNDKKVKYGHKIYTVEKIWSHFCLQKETCLSTSVLLDNTRSFLHLITIDDIIHEFSITELIEMMNSTFFHPVTSRILAKDD